MKYLAEMSDEQTLVLYSGHSLGLFPSHKDAPRVVITNGNRAEAAPRPRARAPAAPDPRRPRPRLSQAW